MDWVYGLSATEENSEHYQGPKGPELNKESFIEYKKLLERTFIHSEPFEDLSGGTNGYPLRFTGGAMYWISTGGGYVQSASGITYTKAMFMTFLRNLFTYNTTGENMKVLLCSPLAIDMFSSWKQDKLEFKPSDKVYNLKVAEWVSGHGTVYLVRDPALENSTAGSGAGYGGHIIAIDPPTVEYRFLQNLDTKLYKNAVIDGRDGKVDIIRGHIGFGMVNPEMSGMVTEISDYE